MAPKAKTEARGRAKAEPKAKAQPKAKASEDARGTKREAASSSREQPAAKKPKTGRSVDSAVPGRGSYSVVDDWSVILNQTNVGANNNKYYKIQVLQKDGKFFCWTHWGRVGADGQNKLEPCANQPAAEKEFKSKFKQKTGIPYENSATTDWKPTVGKYTLVETEETEDGGGGNDAPMGKLTQAQIEKGQGVLKRLEVALTKKGNAAELNNMSSEYYTLIPHNFGFKVPPAITTSNMLETEMELLKFYLRMGFSDMDKVDDLAPISGVMDLPLPKSLGETCSKLCPTAEIKKSDDKGKTHAGKKSGSPNKPMDASLYAAIMLYTSNAIYKELNTALRGENRAAIKKYFPYLRLLLEALGALPQKSKTLWRGVSVDLFDQYTKGSTITWWSVSSCTADQKVAKDFMNGCGGSCTLLTVKTKTAADISDITFFGNEKEHLLAPGTQLKVLSSTRKGKVTEITMEETGRVLQ